MIRLWSVLLLCCGMAGAVEITPPSPVAPYKLVRVKVADGSDVFVLGLVGGQFSSVDMQFCEGGLVFTGAPGSYAVLGSEGGKRFQEIVTIGGNPNPPVPPDPDPPNPDPPEPDPPTPVDVPNKYGIGQTAYNEARRQNKTESAKLAKAYYDVAMALHTQRITPLEAESTVRQARSLLPASWSNWEKAVEVKVQEAVDLHGSGPLKFRDYFYEISRALQEAAK